jgi:hypothetical protein
MKLKELLKEVTLTRGILGRSAVNADNSSAAELAGHIEKTLGDLNCQSSIGEIPMIENKWEKEVIVYCTKEQDDFVEEIIRRVVKKRGFKEVTFHVAD